MKARANRPLVPESIDASFLQRQRAVLTALGERIADETVPSLSARDPEVAKAGDHIGDAAADATDMDLALGALSRERDALGEIRDALERIDLGTYGKCEYSGEPIPRARLEALPFARFTVAVQAQIEAGKLELSRLPAAAATQIWAGPDEPFDPDADDDAEVAAEPAVGGRSR